MPTNAVNKHDLTFHKDLTQAKIKELAELSFLHNLENLLILGKPD
jgi:hypothetical protein